MWFGERHKFHFLSNSFPLSLSNFKIKFKIKHNTTKVVIFSPCKFNMINLVDRYITFFMQGQRFEPWTPHIFFIFLDQMHSKDIIEQKCYIANYYADITGKIS
jgi:hypothetical protein